MREMTLALKLQGTGFEGSLAGLYSRLTDLTPVMDKAGALMLSSVADNFASQGRPERWQGLAPSTVERKGSGAILVETGRLMSSVGFSAGPDSLLVRARAPYALVQQEGGHAGARLKAEIPARPFLLFQEEDVQAIKDMVEEYLAGAV